MTATPPLDHLAQDATLRPLLTRITLPDLPPDADPYLALLGSIVSQQLSVRVADVIFGRFCQLFPDAYPHADQLLALDISLLRGAGLSGQKASYLRHVATFHQSAGITVDKLRPLTDEEVVQYLMPIKGVGRWTVEMLLLFALRRPDVFPVDDLGVRQAMVRLYGLTETGQELRKQLIDVAEPWRPHRSLASRYLWRWKDSQ